jgi:hypothetical protein
MFLQHTPSKKVCHLFPLFSRMCFENIHLIISHLHVDYALNFFMHANNIYCTMTRWSWFFIAIKLHLPTFLKMHLHNHVDTLMEETSSKNYWISFVENTYGALGFAKLQPLCCNHNHQQTPTSSMSFLVATPLWRTAMMTLTLPKWGLGSPPGLSKT